MKKTIGRIANKATDDDEVEVVVSANTSDSEIADYLADKNKEKLFTVHLVDRKLREISRLGATGEEIPLCVNGLCSKRTGV